MAIINNVLLLVKSKSELNINYASVALFIGLLPLLYLNNIPNITTYIFIILLLIAILLFYTVNKYVKFFIFIAMSLLWGGWHASELLSYINKFSMGMHNAQVTVITVPIENKKQQRIKVRIDSLDSVDVFPALYAYWYPAKKSDIKICAGQRWQFQSKLYPVHSLLNEGGFDSQRHYIAQRILGRLKNSSEKLIDSSCSWRQKTIDYYLIHINQQVNRGVIYALMFGERGLLEPQQSQWLQKTGVSHLIAISGLHIGIAYFVGFYLARFIQFFFAYKYIYLGFSVFIGLLTAVIYSWLSGLSIPAIRAIFALSLAIYLRKQPFYCFPWQWAILSMGLILLFDPLAILSDSFWLSCIAVLAILYWGSTIQLNRSIYVDWRLKWIKLLHLQFGLLLLLIPIQLIIFNGFNPAGLLANLWLVPLISCLIIPLLLLIFLLPFDYLQSIVFEFIDTILSISLSPLPFLAQFWLNGGFISPWLVAISGLLPIIYIFGWYGSYCSLIICFLCLVIGIYPQPEAKGWRLTMLDVGHGLAIIMQQGRQALIYDTGKSWQGGDVALSHIIPFLSYHQLEPIGIILSHDHLDHTGGVASLRRHYPGVSLRSNFGDGGHLPCHRGTKWRWKDLVFTVVWPVNGKKLSHNNDSCVIQVTDGYNKILLTGDIEKRGERELVALDKVALTSNIIQVPHHGSNTSSTGLFLRNVMPNLALVSSARYSQWQIPSPKVRDRYQKANIDWLNTSQQGQITLWFNREKIVKSSYRVEIQPRWFHQWFGEIAIPE